MRSNTLTRVSNNPGAVQGVPIITKLGWASESVAFQYIARYERIARLKHPVPCAGV